jgi:hypothetical protein
MLHWLKGLPSFCTERAPEKWLEKNGGGDELTDIIKADELLGFYFWLLSIFQKVHDATQKMGGRVRNGIEKRIWGW